MKKNKRNNNKTHLSKVYCVPTTSPALSHLIHKITLSDRYYCYLYFTHEKMEVKSW